MSLKHLLDRRTVFEKKRGCLRCPYCSAKRIRFTLQYNDKSKHFYCVFCGKTLASINKLLEVNNVPLSKLNEWMVGEDWK